MVRRRTRATVAPKATVNAVLENGSAVALTNAQLLEDQYFASPKRKDCKVEENSSSNDGFQSGASEDDGAVKPKMKSPSPNKMKGERGAINGKTIGVPLATRSQTRTIENFFKANAAAKQHNKSNKYSPEPQKIIQPTLSASVTPPQMVNYNAIITQQLQHQQTNGHDHQNDNGDLQEQMYLEQLQNQNHQQHQPIINRRSLDNVIVPQEFIFDLSEDTNDSERTDISDETPVEQVQETLLMSNGFDFINHRSSQRADSHSSSHSSSNTSATENIFLQEPVLTLNVDKSPNQASSIKINKTLEVEPKFSSPTSLNASVLHGRFNQIVSLNTSPSKRDSFGYEKKPIEMLNGHDYALMMLPENDNSSCDSGVAFTSTTAASLDDSVQASPAPGMAQGNRRRKPATPHRIVCCSPIKAPPRVVSPAGSPSTRKMASALSPRKSQRHLTTSTVAAATTGGGIITTATACKTRRRLNPSPSQATKEHQLPQQQTQSNQEDKHCVHEHDDDEDPVVVLVNDDEDDIDDHDQECENMATNISAPDNKSNPHILNGMSKSILNSAKHPTNQQNATNNRGGKQKSQQSKTKYTVQRPQHAPLKHQAPQPLAATNGNREINDFFPVRRSVRKTKTAVKEEMMRNLEQAILEERSEGLKIAHFEGKGRGIIAERRFQRGEFVIEYVGDLISTTEAAEREKRYALDENAGCYMYYFKHKNQQYCIDATEDTGKLGRLVNHSRNGNLMTKVVVVKQKPHLVLIAKDDIEAGEELCYDYGDRSKESLLHHPWLAF
ncbi:histone-lysine N-methyltransferase PR-Set7 [Lucilia cuprina]|uniref:histone-lysine N-methyltransferase PR-Set7 n=1 Tax=Lucilia cuprina TaxID=7375 RepID=UPI001F0636C6|nr:histone-lysine N-methyltransferase PR-Set7 [Lucilia cuprina]XP_023308943.2 histone-lysine N-methyltransferase PR-Set7 [Lucilia cuprina]